MKRQYKNKVGIALLFLCSLISISFLAIILINIFLKGIPGLSWTFLADYPRAGMTEGGILPAIIGTVLLSLITAIAAVPLGIAAAVYQTEYAKDSWWNRFISLSIRNLAGVPSIIYGLFGVALFVEAMHLGTSLLASGLTLGLMSLPYIITAAEEALKVVPKSLKEGAVALGASKWEAIRTVMLPAATPGIITGIILALSRAAGETAPILFTGVFFYQRHLPSSVLDEFMALPYHLFILSTQHHDIEGVRPLAYTTALVLLILVCSLNLFAFIIRHRYRQRYR